MHGGDDPRVAGFSRQLISDAEVEEKTAEPVVGFDEWGRGGGAAARVTEEEGEKKALCRVFCVKVLVFCGNCKTVLSGVLSAKLLRQKSCTRVTGATGW